MRLKCIFCPFGFIIFFLMEKSNTFWQAFGDEETGFNHFFTSKTTAYFLLGLKDPRTLFLGKSHNAKPLTNKSVGRRPGDTSSLKDFLLHGPRFAHE